MIRMKSSSGGFFTMLAEVVLDEGGVVFGARFDENWEVMHDYTETKEGLEPFRGSKYVQSRVENTYIKAREFLKAGRKVLFTGTSCQIAGLKKFLCKEYDNLLAVDVVCHGVPSPLVWRTYLDEVIKLPKDLAKKNSVLLSLKKLSVITDISFRDKTTGWKKYGFVIRGKSALSSSITTEFELIHETLVDNLYMSIFQYNLDLRPSCYACPAKCGKSLSDFTIADYWGIENYYPELYDDKGISLVMINTDKGNQVIKTFNTYLYETSYNEALAGNHSIEKSAVENPYVLYFWDFFISDGFNGMRKMLKKISPSLTARILSKIKHTLIVIFNN